VTNLSLRLPLLTLAFSLVAGSSAAIADEFYFKTPSGNIHCGYFDNDGNATVRCDIESYTPTTRKRPADCDLDWGFAFEIGARAKRGIILCAGDTVISQQAVTLAYGSSWKRKGITCSIEETGVTCTNRRGRGFFLSRAEQRVF
jgi:hypothetical protein